MNVVTKVFVLKFVRTCPGKYGQLSGLNIGNIRVVGLACRNSGKEAGGNPN